MQDVGLAARKPQDYLPVMTVQRAGAYLAPMLVCLSFFWRRDGHLLVWRLLVSFIEADFVDSSLYPALGLL